jgi:hypothetical protein
VVVVPAWVWRGGLIVRALTLGLIAGIFLGAVSFADSGIWLGSLVVFVVLTVTYAVVMARRMRRYWPGAKELTGADRMAVARAARRGENIGDARLASAVVDYSAGLRAAYEHGRSRRWVIWVVVAAVVIAAVVDCFIAPVRSLVVSWLFVGFLAVELWWWPMEQARLVANADRAANLARAQYLAS